MNNIETTAVLGAGVIGASWTALFLAAGTKVNVYDPDPATAERVRQYVGDAWPALEGLGLTGQGDPDAVNFFQSPVEAVSNAQFIQENVPERIELKHQLYREIEPHLDPDAVVASSASGLTVTEIAGRLEGSGTISASGIRLTRLT